MTGVALISDIHGNLEALKAVLEDIERQGIKEVHCLGDIVGYGPDPIACTDMTRERCRIVIRGNHDEALIKGPLGFNPLAREAIEWTRRQMRPGIFRRGSRNRWEFLESLPLQEGFEDYYLVHGSPRDPTSEYVMPQHAEWPPQPNMFEEIFAAFSSVCFVGHTHIPGVFVEGGGELLLTGGEQEKLEGETRPAAYPGAPAFVPQSEIPEGFRRSVDKLLINVGSVGQPRDRNWRACYLTVKGGEFRFHRVEYSWQITRQKIRRISDLDNRLGDRLGLGE